MSFGDLSTRTGLQALNNYLESRSYLDGYVPTQADRVVFEAMKQAPAGDLFHAVRWYNHVNSFSEAERQAFAASTKTLASFSSSAAAPAGGKPAAAAAADDDDDVDLFGDDDEEDNAEAERLKAERIAAYDAKKSKKPTLIAKSSITLDVKPWDDETDLKQLEENVRSIEMDGLVWGQSKQVPIAYGVKKLQIICVVEDDKVSTEELEERICAFDDFVQSVDIVAFNKI